LTCSLLLALLAAPAGFAQQNNTAPAPAPENEEVLTVEQMPSFVSGVEVVTVPVTVMGPDDQYVSGLEKTDFRIFDNDVEQQIDSFEVAFLPISMVVCVQSSARVEGLLPDIKKTAVLFTDLVLGEFGQAAVIAFDNRVRLMHDFTNSTEDIDKALKDVTVGSDAARLSDALYDAVRLLNRRPASHRKIIVAISESQNNGSEIGLGEVLRTAQLSDIMFYAVRLSSLSARLLREPEQKQSPFPPGIQSRPIAPGGVATPTTMQQSYGYQATPNIIPIIIDLVRGVKNLVFDNPLELMAKGTGGMDYSPRTEDGLQESIAKIGEDIRSQYLLSYRPNNRNQGGIFHHIRVETPYEQLKVRARPGYFYAPEAVPGGEPVEADPQPHAEKNND
jgi:Ca-activated chloride channel family protein